MAGFAVRGLLKWRRAVLAVRRLRVRVLRVQDVHVEDLVAGGLAVRGSAVRGLVLVLGGVPAADAVRDRVRRPGAELG